MRDFLQWWLEKRVFFECSDDDAASIWGAAQQARPDCNTCVNRGRIDGLSQETHCEHCKYQETWRTNHYAPNYRL
jgi:hypothetical protein